jgi:hypothetical protein
VIRVTLPFDIEPLAAEVRLGLGVVPISAKDGGYHILDAVAYLIPKDRRAGKSLHQRIVAGTFDVLRKDRGGCVKETTHASPIHTAAADRMTALLAGWTHTGTILLKRIMLWSSLSRTSNVGLVRESRLGQDLP